MVTRVNMIIEPSDQPIHSELQVYFENAPDMAGIQKSILIYNDPGFIDELKKIFVGLGIPRSVADLLTYSSPAMQGLNSVSFDANGLDEYIVYQFIIGDAATVDSRKSDVIKNILKLIKDDGASVAANIVSKLQEMGVTWPELDVLERSLHN